MIQFYVNEAGDPRDVRHRVAFRARAAHIASTGLSSPPLDFALRGRAEISQPQTRLLVFVRYTIHD